MNEITARRDRPRVRLFFTFAVVSVGVLVFCTWMVFRTLSHIKIRVFPRDDIVSTAWRDGHGPWRTASASSYQLLDLSNGFHDIEFRCSMRDGTQTSIGMGLNVYAGLKSRTFRIIEMRPSRGWSFSALWSDADRGPDLLLSGRQVSRTGFSASLSCRRPIEGSPHAVTDDPDEILAIRTDLYTLRVSGSAGRSVAIVERSGWGVDDGGPVRVEIRLPDDTRKPLLNGKQPVSRRGNVYGLEISDDDLKGESPLHVEVPEILRIRFFADSQIGLPHSWYLHVY